MASISIWHWLVVLVVLFGVFGLPILAVRKERTDIRISRIRYAGWLLAVLFVIPFAVGVLAVLMGIPEGAEALGILSFIALAYPFFQRVVRRARDAGRGKAIAYWAIVPVVSVVALLLLLFLPPKPSVNAEIFA